MKRLQHNSKGLLILVLTCISLFTATAQGSCYDPTVIDASEVCYQMGIPGVYCGCDGNVYSSPCEAYYHYGVTSGAWSADGSCGQQGTCKASFAYGQTAGANGVEFRNISFINTLHTGTSTWDFGDGTTSADSDPLHTFPAPGTYQVCLAISVVEAGDTCTDTYCETVYVGITQPCIDPALIDTAAICYEVYAPVCGCDGVTYDNDCVAEAHGVISWTYGACYPNWGCSAYFYYYGNDATGTGIVFYADYYGANPDYRMFWSFGDGSTLDTLANSGVHHQYAAPGLYNVCLTVYAEDSSCIATYCEIIPAAATDKCIDSTVIDTTVVCNANGAYEPVCGTCDGVTYNNACEAFYHHGVVSWTSGECYYYPPCEAKYYYWLDGDGYTVNFQSAFSGVVFPGDPNGSNGPPSPSSQSLLWDFGDGTTSTDAYPVHTYTDTSIRAYWVCLTVSDSVESCSNTFCDSVYVGYNVYGCHAGFGYSVNPDGTVLVYPDAALENVPGWYWNGIDGTSPNGSGFSFVVDSASNDTICVVLVNDVMNCVDTFCIGEPEIYLAYLLSGYGNAANETLKKFSLYPNPAMDEVSVELTLLAAADVTIQVRDFLGNEQLLITATEQAGNKKLRINTSQLPAGMYIVEANAAGQRVFKKLVISR